MNNISFASTYRVPLVSPGINKAKRGRLKVFAGTCQNSLFPNGQEGAVRISVNEKEDAFVENKIRQLGFKNYQKFNLHNLAPNTMDTAIKEALNKGEYSQFGKQRKGKKH